MERLLLLDHNQEEVERYYNYLNSFGMYQTFRAHTIESGIEIFEKEPLTCVLLGHEPPNLNCLKFLERISKGRERLPLSVVLSVRHGDEAILAKALEYGVHFYFNRKSFQPELLRSLIQKSIEQFRDTRNREEFFAKINHEIRSAVTVVKGSIDGLHLGVDEDQNGRHARMVRLAQANCNRLIRVVTKLLEFSRLESGIVPLNKKMGDLGVLVRDITKIHRESLKQSGLAFSFSVEPDLPRIVFDEHMMIEVLNNLLGNARRFARSWVHASVERFDVASSPFRLTNTSFKQGLLIKVQNDGVGIPKKHLALVCDKFVQSRRAVDDTSYKGTGLGLAICKEIVKQHEGEIWIDSEENVVTTVHIALPET